MTPSKSFNHEFVVYKNVILSCFKFKMELVPNQNTTI